MCARRRERSGVCDGRRRGISDVLPVANMHVLEWNRVYIGGDMSVYRYCSKKIINIGIGFQYIMMLYREK